LKKKILISTGGSGGHVIPALNFYEHLKQNNEVFITSDLRGLKFIDTKNYNYKTIDVPDIKKNKFKFPLNLIFFLSSIIKSFFYLKKNNIDNIISTGGYVTFPVCIAAMFTKSKLFLFEPNMVLGRSNLFFLKHCKKIFCYSDTIRKFPSNYIHKIQTIYPLLDKKSYNLKNDFKKSSDQKVFLVIGGSQGAKFFQTELKNTLNKLSKKFNLFVYHQTSAENFKDLEIFYKQNNIDYQLFDFESYLESILLKTDFCITRAGASTLAELAFFEVPFLAIPFPYSKDDHQVYNAKYYKDNNCCWMLDQKEALQKNLFEIISNILVDKKNLQLKKKAMNKISSKNTWENNYKIIINTINEN
jgi:UDP-N-acetylglucosamine--N-acetylmuramyl-(pentapeptide) pyrophosphoryl-undecaprenol N-acetylglucosamine transferase